MTAELQTPEPKAAQTRRTKPKFHEGPMCDSKFSMSLGLVQKNRAGCEFTRGILALNI